MSHELPWWKGAVIYQIYPRSFQDTSKDGLGDLKGITSRLNYLRSLGVDAIWVSPFFKSPMKDFGYDVSDYRAIDPSFGTMEDFDLLIAEAHKNGIKVMIDLVISHSADQHPWFLESRQNKTNPKADWYVWADAKPDGTPPNNWLSIFGGSAWQWESRRSQYYLHNFLSSQPDFNFHNEEVVTALLGEAEFWLKKGVNGFRLDTVNFYVHDKELRDNPPQPHFTHLDNAVPANNPYVFQQHIYDKSRPENLQVLARLRALMDKYPGTTTIGEVGDDDSLSRACEYVQGIERLHMAYNFAFLGTDFTTKFIKETIEALEHKIGDGWPCWSFGNHDFPRCATRLSKEVAPELYDAFLRLLMAVLLSLRGTVIIYQGEELGLPEADLPFEALRDPYGINFYPEFKGRDGCRTPMPWNQGSLYAGFSEKEPWLPIPDEHKKLSVDLQEKDASSLLNCYRHFIAWRHEQKPLKVGSIHFIEAESSLLAFEREFQEEIILCLFNCSEMPLSFSLKDYTAAIPLNESGFKCKIINNMIELTAYAACFLKVKRVKDHDTSKI